MTFRARSSCVTHSLPQWERTSVAIIGSITILIIIVYFHTFGAMNELKVSKCYLVICVRSGWGRYNSRLFLLVPSLCLKYLNTNTCWRHGGFPYSLWRSAFNWWLHLWDVAFYLRCYVVGSKLWSHQVSLINFGKAKVAQLHRGVLRKTMCRQKIYNFCTFKLIWRSS